MSEVEQLREPQSTQGPPMPQHHLDSMVCGVCTLHICSSGDIKVKHTICLGKLKYKGT